MKQNTHIIFHIDGDAFFASCETSTKMSLRGKPIVVGRERGVATAFSYEAKALGVTRGMKVHEIIRDFPNVATVSSDYRKYALFSERFKNIVKTYTPRVEGMSIDECYADMTDVVGDFAQAERMARILQRELSVKLGMTFSIGVGPNKSIAKIASGMNKPHGVTVITPDTIPQMLHHKSIGIVSGIGARSQDGLRTNRIYTIGDLLARPYAWIQDNFSLPYKDIYRELKGEFLKPMEYVVPPPKGISKIHALAHATRDRAVLLSEFVRNAEIVARKMHTHKLQGKSVTLGMKLPRIPGKSYQGSYFVRIELKPTRPVRHTQDIVDLIREHFDTLFIDGFAFRATYVAVNGLRTLDSQTSLFEVITTEEGRGNALAELYGDLEKKYGRSVLQRATALVSEKKQTSQVNYYNTGDAQGTPLIRSSEGNRILYIPYLGVFS